MRCKPGDLALVTSAISTPEMLGRFVIVERRAVPGEVLAVVDGVHLRTYPEDDWVIRATSGQLCARSRSTRKLYQVPLRAWRDCGLRPIPPEDPDAVTDTTKELETT